MSIREDGTNQTGEPIDPKQSFAWRVSLAGLLTVFFILQVAAVVGCVCYLAYRNSQSSVADLTNQLMTANSQRVTEKLTSYLMTARLANQINSDAVLRGDLALTLDKPNAQQEAFLWQHMTLFRNLAWITIGSQQDGSSIGIWRPGPRQNLQFSLANPSTQYFGNYYDTNERGVRTTFLKVEKPIFDVRTRPWYQAAIAAKTAIWTHIYPGFTPGTIFIAASQPLYNRQGALVGVSGSDISLLGIQDFLAQNPVSPKGQTFIIERSGLLVASSSQEPPFRKAANQKPQQVDVLHSQTPLIRATAQALRQQFGDFATLQPQSLKFHYQIDQQSQFVQVVPFQQKPGLDWLIVIVVPESDVMAQINAGTRTTIWIGLATLLGAIGLNALISRWLIKPIRLLSQASQKMAQGDFRQPVQVSRIRELHRLTVSFDQMRQEIQQSRQTLEEYSQALEQKVSDRTQALQLEIHHRMEAEAALQEVNQELKRLAYLDGLTQIANRRWFDEQLLQEWQRLKREQLPLSLILCDVDYFKQYNDTYGHQAGDQCLCDVAKAIATAARRPSDLAARYGGEEFAVLLPNTTLVGAIEVAKVIQTHVKGLQIPHRSSKVSQYITASFGVISLNPNQDESPDQLLIEADQALYQAKMAGRDRIVSN